MITDYDVVTATHLADLQDRVRQRIKSGWQPIGGIALLHEEDAGSNKPHMVFCPSDRIRKGFEKGFEASKV